MNLHKLFGHTYHYRKLHRDFRCECGELRHQYNMRFTARDEIKPYRA